MIGQNGEGEEFWGYFCPEQGLSALNFRGRAEKVVVHMYWLTWLLWRPCIFKSVTNGGTFESGSIFVHLKPWLRFKKHCTKFKSSSTLESLETIIGYCISVGVSYKV